MQRSRRSLTSHPHAKGGREGAAYRFEAETKNSFVSALVAGFAGQVTLFVSTASARSKQQGRAGHRAEGGTKERRRLNLNCKILGSRYPDHAALWPRLRSPVLTLAQAGSPWARQSSLHSQLGVACKPPRSSWSVAADRGEKAGRWLADYPI